MEPFGKGKSNFPVPIQDSINRTSFNSKTNQLITGHGSFVTCLYRFGLCPHDRCACEGKGDSDCHVKKNYHFTKPSVGNLSTWCEHIVQSKSFLA
ncbi:hypothetical protein AVEN_188823-1 [Araneus ventricosus]|uniref:Uncharacterized protein n=1 Tax=Araneus ventricosus TaxID=182803 RepID=A0A4Y2BS84_ARAVE|nr:hypothetical protein AVEN_188823-1 [Araneus ventricosus]